MSLETRTVKILGPAGILARTWTEFEPRDGQLDLAVSIARAIETGTKAVVEAGTGTGKTLAYLIPVILSGQRTIISTATKNLQEQIVGKDLPFLTEHLSAAPKVCLVKGRTNYLCRQRLEKNLASATIDAWLGKKLLAWADSSDNGDRAEVDFIPEADPLWTRLTASSDQCLGQSCEFFGRCFITRLRQRAGAATIVVANHHLFMADLALKQAGHGQVLPESEVVVFDEAHELESAATSHFTVAVSDLRVIDLARDLYEANPERLRPLAEGLRRAALDLALTFDFRGDRANLSADLLGDETIKAGDYLADLLAEAKRAALNEVGDESEAGGLAGRAERLIDDLALIIGRLEPEYVYYAERLRRGLSLKAAPVEVAGIMDRMLFRSNRGFVFTSATLDPERFRARLGLGTGVDELTFDSPFDFKANSRLYIPAKMVLPSSPGFPAAVAKEMAQLVEISRGRAFLLFTSYRNLEAVYKILSARLRYPVLKQGDAPKAKLIDDFITQQGAVLFATAAFWQGVDIAGPALSLVAIDKLPFAPPDDPLVAARIERLQALGEQPFMSYQVPEAALGLRQGLGRLIRSHSDTGLLAVLDTRLVSKPYGKIILKSLPPSPVVRDLSRIMAWAERKL